MTKPRITKHSLGWVCRAPLRPGWGFGLTPAEAYRNWLLDSQRPMLSPQPLPQPQPRLMPMHEPVTPWPAYQPPLYAPGVPGHRFTSADPWQPPWTITCRH